MDETPPVKRGPGRPRKNPLPEQAPEPVAAPEVRAPRRSALALELKRSLSAGDRGGQVKMVQDRLAALGLFTIDRDGYYGHRLTLAVRQFQHSRGLRVTGDVNVPTWEALFSEEGN